MSRASNILNHIATLKDVIKTGPVTTLNIQMNICVTTRKSLKNPAVHEPGGW